MAVQCLPRITRVAMLEGLRSNEIIVGAYSRDGGICPMLAAHRNGGRTSMISFARAWDRFALGDARRAGARRATPRELRVLITMLEASLLDDELPGTELAAAIASHKRLIARREAAGASEEHASTGTGARRARAHAGTPRAGDAHRGAELRSRPGWAWTRLVRSYNEYERALEWIQREQDAHREREHQPA